MEGGSPELRRPVWLINRTHLHNTSEQPTSGFHQPLSAFTGAHHGRHAIPGLQVQTNKNTLTVSSGK
ncbi:Uncharacterized protein HZ326_18663 [Fusarium oxysporum f. sp. albedinis]|nr:Oxidoreductase UcpA [Fusarium oxysporum f. sp. albedinis]KAJ0138380.1 Uncharacterized protein HZ326_18663 [Fusarium oxysporum f. sp. albedinis]